MAATDLGAGRFRPGVLGDERSRRGVLGDGLSRRSKSLADLVNRFLYELPHD